MLAIISVMAALVINAFSNATQDSRNVVARQQQASIQSALSSWVNSHVGHVVGYDTDSDGVEENCNFTVGLTRNLYNFRTNWWTNSPSNPRTSKQRIDLIVPYLDESTREHFTENTPGSEDTNITSAAMRKTGTSISLPTWAAGDREYPRVNFNQPD